MRASDFRRVSRLSVWVSALWLAFVPAAGAQVSKGDARESRAEELFRKGRRRLDERRRTEACQLFRESLAMKPGVGNLLNVGACLVQEGEPALALERFEQALALAEATSDPALRRASMQVAQQQIDELLPQVGHVALRFASMPGLSFELNGKAVASSHLRLKPGAYELRAQAPGHVAYSRHFELGASQRLELVLPPLQPVARGESGVEPEPASRVVPWVLIGTGSALTAAGAITGVVTLGKASELEENCRGDVCPSASRDPGWQDKIDTADRWALASTLLVGVGLASVSVGIGLFLWGGPAGNEAGPSRVEAGCAGEACGLRWHGRF